MSVPAVIERSAAETRPVGGATHRWQVLAAVTLAPLVVLTGCSSSSSSSAGSAKSSGSDSSAVVADATARLKSAETTAVTGPSVGAVTAAQIVPWTASLMPVPAPLATGKAIKVDVVYGIPTGAVPYTAHLFQAIGAKLGWSIKIVQAGGQTQQASLTAMQQAVLDKPDAIIGEVTPGAWVGQALEQAKKQGIVTVNLHQDSTTGPGYDAWVPDAEGIQKSLMAAYAIKASNGTAKSLLFDAPGFSDANMPAAKAYLATCSGCKTQSTQLNPQDFTDPVKVQSDVTAQLASHPDLDFLTWPNGSLPIQPVLTAISASANKNAQLLINGSAPAPLQLLKSGQIPLLIHSPDALLVLVALDDINRLVQHQAPVAEDALRVPISYWTKANAPAGSNFSDITRAQLSNDWLTPYEKAWNVSLKDVILGVSN